ncbi:MAG: nucleotidyltransferase domain-containing protein [Chloroflexota bacterium]|nr:nucleotidyltransferase domain-containing protein [Chloroflexota bacterium]
MKTVTNDLLQEMTRRLVEQFQPERVVLFGSRAWGIPDRGSDVGLTVIVTHSDLSDQSTA